jgi:hypothetical protein
MINQFVQRVSYVLTDYFLVYCSKGNADIIPIPNTIDVFWIKSNYMFIPC